MLQNRLWIIINFHMKWFLCWEMFRNVIIFSRMSHWNLAGTDKFLLLLFQTGNNQFRRRYDRCRVSCRTLLSLISLCCLDCNFFNACDIKMHSFILYPSIYFIMCMRACVLIACERPTSTLKKEKVHQMEFNIYLTYILPLLCSL